ncbi:MAG: hypothetical protein HC828_17950 [Blastochloris sp.]|nr:hypothetical protein [Blastochloris sp.]
MTWRTMNAAHQLASTFGALAGLAGIEHGVGEILQGNRAPGGIVIESWPHSALFRILGGEPALTLVPNLLVTGILAVSVALALLVWAVAFVQRKRGGLILILLSVAMFLVGGGFGSALVGVIAGAVGTRITAPHTWWRAHLSVNAQRVLATVWPWSFGAALMAWLTLLPGALIIGAVVPRIDSNVIYGLIVCAFSTLAVTIMLGLAHDSYKHIGSR